VSELVKRHPVQVYTVLRSCCKTLCIIEVGVPWQTCKCIFNVGYISSPLTMQLTEIGVLSLENMTYPFKGTMSFYLLSFQNAKTCLHTNWISKIMVQFCLFKTTIIMISTLKMFLVVFCNGWQRRTLIETWLNSWPTFSSLNALCLQMNQIILGAPC